MDTIGLIIIGLGFASGVVGALLGIGGGIIFVPSLLLLTQYPQKTIVGASLFTVVASSVVAVMSSIKRKTIHFELATSLEMFIIAGTLTGVLIAGYFSKSLLLLLLGLLVLIIACQTIYQYLRIHFYSKQGKIFAEHVVFSDISKFSQWAMNFIASFVGVLAGVLGIGGGILMVPAFANVVKFPIKSAVTTSAYLMGISGSTGALIYLLHGDVDAKLTSLAILGVLPGSITGRWVAERIAPQNLRLIFGLLLLFYGVRLCWNK